MKWILFNCFVRKVLFDDDDDDEFQLHLLSITMIINLCPNEMNSFNWFLFNFAQWKSQMVFVQTMINRNFENETVFNQFREIHWNGLSLIKSQNNIETQVRSSPIERILKYSLVYIDNCLNYLERNPGQNFRSKITVRSDHIWGGIESD